MIETLIAKQDVIRQLNQSTDDHDENDSVYAALFKRIFAKAVSPKYKKPVADIFFHAHEIFPDKKIYLGDCICGVICDFNDCGELMNRNDLLSEEFAKNLLDKDFIELVKKDEDYSFVLKELICSYWFDVAAAYIQAVPEADKVFAKLKEDIPTLISLKEGKDRADKVTSLLQIKLPCYILSIYRDFSGWDMDEEVELKFFNSLEDIKAYVSREYDVLRPHENPEMWRGRNGEYFQVL